MPRTFNDGSVREAEAGRARRLDVPTARAMCIESMPTAGAALEAPRTWSFTVSSLGAATVIPLVQTF